MDLAINFEDRTKSEEDGFDIVNVDFIYKQDKHSWRG